MGEYEVRDIEVFDSDGFSAELDYDPETGELVTPTVEVPPPADRTGGLESEDVPLLQMSPDEMKALSYDEKQKYGLAIAAYIATLAAKRGALADEVARYHANKEFLTLGNRATKSMTLVQRRTWDQKMLELAEEQLELARTAYLSVQYSEMIQAFSRVASVVQTCIRAEMAEGNLTP